MTDDEMAALPDDVRKTLEAWMPAGLHGNTEHLEADEEPTPGLYFCGPGEHLESKGEEEDE